MKTLQQAASAVLVGVGLTLALAGAASAQEIPTGAARIIEKVQTRIFISKSTLVFKVEAILANQPSPGGGE